MQVTKELIDEFEEDWKPIKRIYYCFSIEMYRPRDYLMESHVHREADTQQGRLEAWLKQREKVEGIASVLEATLDDDLNARNTTESYNALIKGIMEALKLCLCQPQEQG